MTVTRVLNVTDADAITQAVAVLQRGGLVAFPTDTVYGVGSDAFQPAAVTKLYEVKERPSHMAIPLLLGHVADVRLVAANVPRLARLLMREFWPGGLTIVLERLPIVPDAVTSGGNTVALRLPDHVVPRSLAKRLGVPLAATSANRSGQRSPVTAQDVLADLGGRIDLILDGGPCPGGVESTIVDLTGTEMRLVREGAIPWRKIQAFQRSLLGSSHADALLHAP